MKVNAICRLEIGIEAEPRARKLEHFQMIYLKLPPSWLGTWNQPPTKFAPKNQDHVKLWSWPLPRV